MDPTIKWAIIILCSGVSNASETYDAEVILHDAGWPVEAVALAYACRHGMPRTTVSLEYERLSGLSPRNVE